MSEQPVTMQIETAQIPAHEAHAGDESSAPPPVASYPWLEKARHLFTRMLNIVDAMNQWMSPSGPIDAELTPDDVTRRPILIGGWAFIILFGVIGLWAALAPLASAAIAPGKVILSGNMKLIQHLEGGVVDEILVREGQTVRAGQPLIRLNETAARARLDLFRKQYLAAKATEARLIAERDGLDKIDLPKELREDKDDATVQEMVISQQRLFESRRLSMEGQTKVLEQKKAQYDDEIVGLKSQIASASEQINLLEEEIRAVKKLLAQGNAQKPRLLALQRQQAELKGNRGDYQARISRAQQAIGEADIQIINLKNEFDNKVAQEMRETVDKLADLQERLKASTDIIDRIIIRAPLSGVVQGLAVHTVGGVIKPGETVMGIVPIDELVVEAKVSPKDIDVVHDGLEARVSLSAYSRRKVPPLDGVVIYVSPDRFEDPKNGAAYFVARVRLNQKELSERHSVEMVPGMPADVLIVTGERTVLSYLFLPITESFRKAFRED